MFRDVREHRSAQTYTIKIVFTTYGLRCSDNLKFSWFLAKCFANLAIINLYSKGHVIDGALKWGGWVSMPGRMDVKELI